MQGAHSSVQEDSFGSDSPQVPSSMRARPIRILIQTKVSLKGSCYRSAITSVVHGIAEIATDDRT